LSWRLGGIIAEAEYGGEWGGGDVPTRIIVKGEKLAGFHPSKN